MATNIPFHVIVLNGPRGSGKTALANAWAAATEKVQSISFKTALMQHTCDYYQYPLAMWNARYHAHKLEPNAELGGLTMVQALIHVSEVVNKPMHGKDMYGRALGDEIVDQQQMYNWPPSIYITDDGDFFEEIIGLSSTIQDSGGKVHLIRLERADHTFEGDSRTYITVPKPDATLVNDCETSEDWIKKGIAFLEGFLYNLN